MNFPSISIDQYWFLSHVSSGCTVLPNSKLMLHTPRKSQPGPGEFFFWTRFRLRNFPELKNPPLNLAGSYVARLKGGAELTLQHACG